MSDLIWLIPVVLVWVLVGIKVDTGLPWSCIFGFHKYEFPCGEKHGMHIDKKGNLVGTRRQLWVCRCGARKPKMKEDFIKESSF